MIRKDCLQEVKIYAGVATEDKKNALQTRKTLQRLQDILGALHDYDFTIDYLSSLGQSSTRNSRDNNYRKRRAECKIS